MHLFAQPQPAHRRARVRSDSPQPSSIIFSAPLRAKTMLVNVGFTEFAVLITLFPPMKTFVHSCS